MSLVPGVSRCTGGLRRGRGLMLRVAALMACAVDAEPRRLDGRTEGHRERHAEDHCTHGRHATTVDGYRGTPRLQWHFCLTFARSSHQFTGQAARNPAGSATAKPSQKRKLRTEPACTPPTM